MKENSSKPRHGRKRRRSTRSESRAETPTFDGSGAVSGSLASLADTDCARIHAAALEILDTVGFAEAPDFTRERLLDAGCRETEQGRICFPPALVEDTIAAANKSLVLYGQRSEHDLEVSGNRTWFSTGCGSVRVIDPQTRDVRALTVNDVYDFARLADQLDNIHMFHRLGIPTEIEDTDLVDINLCYAAVRGTSKPVSSSWFNGENVNRSLAMLHLIAGGEKRWRDRPFVMNTNTFVVPPLKFSPESCLGLENAIRGGMPVQLTSSGQQGATAPVTIAGTIVQTIAEVLGGLVYACQIAPDARVMLGAWPMVSDLRTGAATTGSPEQALVSSVSCQMAKYYGIPNGAISGISDSKLPDAQSGFEKGIQHALVGNSGGNVLFCAAGALAGGLGSSHAGLVIDNEIIGAALRTVVGFRIDDEELAVDVIRDVCLNGPGYFLGHDQTIQRMKGDFFYPRIADRQSLNDWLEQGSPSILDHAISAAHEILERHHPQHLELDIDQSIRQQFDIRLNLDSEP